jgi:hypothetical protein
MIKDDKNGFTGETDSTGIRGADYANGEHYDNGAVEQAIQNVGRKLKATYDDVVNQPVPDRFLHLLDNLERKEKL